MQNRVLMLLLLLLFAVTAVSAQDAPEASGELTLTPLGTYATGAFDEGAAEIVAFDPATSTAFVVNGNDDAIDMLDLSDPAAPTLKGQIALAGGPNSVAVYGDLVAVAVEGENVDSPGMVAFFNTAGEAQGMVEVGVLPDMVIFTPDGSKVLSANEGEPSDDYTIDPEGSVSIIDLSGGVAAAAVTHVTFTDFNAGGARADELSSEVRVYGPGASVAQDLEPEYIAVSPDSSTAYVTLQENNAVAVIDIAAGTITAIVPLGYKDFSQPGNELDASNEDGAINITNWPAFGMYLPDAIAAYEANGTLYLVTANEGDSRDYEGYSEEGEVSEVTLDPAVFPNAAEIQQEAQLGKLEITTTLGDPDGDGDYDALYAPGTRSFSIWDAASGTLVWDSGSAIERITAAAYPDDFNSTNDENGNPEDRSDNAGPEPEGVVLGVIDGQTYAFVGLERIGGVVVYNISDPTAPVFVTYVNTRDFAGDPEAGTAGDLGPEGLAFVPAESSPTGAPLLIVSYEVSGTTTVYEISVG